MMKDKRLLFILTIMILMIVSTISTFGQSFYHKKMKKVKYPEIKNCAAMQPMKTFKERRKTAKLYTQKRERSNLKRDRRIYEAKLK